jgi:hypothetical protein
MEMLDLAMAELRFSPSLARYKKSRENALKIANGLFGSSFAAAN